MKIFLSSLIVLIGSSSLYALTEAEALELIEKAQTCCTVLEHYYQPAFNLLEKPQSTPLLRAIGAPYFETATLATTRLAETSPTFSIPSIDSALDLLTKLHTLLSKAKEVVHLTQTVVDGIEILVKKLGSLRKALYDYLYPQEPKKEEPTPVVSL